MGTPQPLKTTPRGARRSRAIGTRMPWLPRVLRKLSVIMRSISFTLAPTIGSRLSEYTAGRERVSRVIPKLRIVLATCRSGLDALPAFQPFDAAEQPHPSEEQAWVHGFDHVVIRTGLEARHLVLDATASG